MTFLRLFIEANISISKQFIKTDIYLLFYDSCGLLNISKPKFFINNIFKKNLAPIFSQTSGAHKIYEGFTISLFQFYRFYVYLYKYTYFSLRLGNSIQISCFYIVINIPLTPTCDIISAVFICVI